MLFQTGDFQSFFGERYSSDRKIMVGPLRANIYMFGLSGIEEVLPSANMAFHLNTLLFNPTLSCAFMLI